MDKHEALRAGLPGLDQAQPNEHLRELHAELTTASPRPAVIAKLADQLSTHPELGFTVASWWNAPQTQAIIADLNAMGL